MKFLLLAGYHESLINFRGPLIQALLARGLDVHVAAPGLSSDQEVRSQLESLGVNVHDIPLHRTGMNPFFDLFSLYTLWKLMRDVQPNYLLAYTIKPVIYGVLAGWLARVDRRYALITGLGYAFQGDEQHKSNKLFSLVRLLYGFALKRAQKVFFQNPDDEKLFRTLGILNENNASCVVNGSGIAIDQFSFVAVKTQPKFLLIARLLGSKGVREYVAAAKVLKARHPQATFQLAGWIDENPDAISIAELEDWVSSGIIEYLGKLDDVRPVLAECSVYVLPSYREGTPRTVLEAMAIGRAVVTTDAPGCRETVLNEVNGVLIPVRSVDLLVKAMERFILNPDLAVQMGYRSREIAVEKYNVNKVNAVMMEEMGIR